MSREQGIRGLGERGMVSFTVTLIMMMVITLIVIGFSQVTRRNQRESLDRQLSSQAFYAAESGINVTRSAIQSYITANPTAALTGKTTCSNDYDPGAAGGNGGAISTLASDVRYTCVLVNPHPSNVVYDVNQQGSVVAQLNSASGNFTSLTFKWDKEAGQPDTSCNTGTSYTFPPLANWTCGDGLIRVDLLKMPTAGSLSYTDLDPNVITLYLSPMGAPAGTLNASVAGAKAFAGSASGCASACQITVTLPGNTAAYAARMTSVYRNAKGLQISGMAGATPVVFDHSQVIVDVTGKAQDELRRIQARVDLAANTDSSNIPLNTVSSSSDICKNFALSAGDNVDGVCPNP